MCVSATAVYSRKSTGVSRGRFRVIVAAQLALFHGYEIPSICYANLSPGPHKFSIHFLFSAEARSATSTSGTAGGRGREKEWQVNAARREDPDDGTVERVVKGERWGQDRVTRTGYVLLRCSLRLFFFFLPPPYFRLRARVALRARTSDREEHTRQEERPSRERESIVPSFVYSPCEGWLSCNGRRCVETGGRGSWRDFANGDANWSLSLSLFPRIFVRE